MLRTLRNWLILAADGLIHMTPWHSDWLCDRADEVLTGEAVARAVLERARLQSGINIPEGKR